MRSARLFKTISVEIVSFVCEFCRFHRPWKPSFSVPLFLQTQRADKVDGDTHCACGRCPKREMLTVRTSNFVGLFSGLVCAAMLSVPAHARNPLQVKTDRGPVAGKMTADGQVREFLGIPYAAPPVGPLRWKVPQPAAKWHGVHQATAFGSRCMQASLFPDMHFRDPGPSEDCLTLNVWTPAKDKHAKLPVMVWIFGGGFVAGGTSEPRQDGQYLAHKGVLVVSMNYRLGIFGFFALPTLAAESPKNASGNYGLMDQVAALQWVKRNIARFGGDPNNVTIFGESAGSMSVSAQMASPLSQGLFVHAIGESGGAFQTAGINMLPAQAAEKEGESFAQRALGTSDLTKLRAISATDILQAATTKTGGRMLAFRPDIDGDFLPESVAAIYAAGKQAHVPLLAGWNKDEGKGQVVNAKQQPTVASLQAMAQQNFGSQAGDFLRAYSANNDAEAVRVAEDYAGDRFIAYSTWAWLEAQVKTGNAPVYRYRFDLGSPGDVYHSAAIGAFHSDDIEYVFGTLDSRQGAKWRPEDRQLSELMQNYWTNFAKKGNPNSSGLPDWPVYHPQDWMVMHLGPNAQARPDRHRDRYLFLQQYWAK
jgi:para-nitrobenzyl esterase